MDRRLGSRDGRKGAEAFQDLLDPGKGAGLGLHDTGYPCAQQPEAGYARRRSSCCCGDLAVAAEEKEIKYQDAATNYHIIPVAIETLGPFGP